MTAILIREGVTLAEARERLDIVSAVNALLAFGHDCPKLTTEFRETALSGRMTVQQVRVAVLDAMADIDAETVVDNKRPTSSGEPCGPAPMKRDAAERSDKKPGSKSCTKLDETTGR
ncbi:hypothetical protein P7D22_04735 [Lichenihabitans sp. Uapishka_5]|uniref:hypothetical protein n=1 Tax=Lichenihabitans sp. Uapishka_5 TaxID=3037302 RepID=UPI0029E7DC8D|nr:hypothetical protein [Lichenihabitans sp. Uapishka_5]MDX7950485.1 hypothetical protein [Lichenihabitans sp. Uapishka_5]